MNKIIYLGQVNIKITQKEWEEMTKKKQVIKKSFYYIFYNCVEEIYIHEIYIPNHNKG